MLSLLKKIAFYVLIILGILYGYTYFTGKSLLDLPAEIVSALQQKAATKNTNPVYAEDPAKEMHQDNR